MKLNVYSSTVGPLLISELEDPQMMFYMTNQMQYQFAQISFGLEVHPQTYYPVKITWSDKDTCLISIPVGTPTPFTQALENQADRFPVDPNSLVIQQKGIMEAFGLEIVGLDGFVEGYVESPAVLYNAIYDKFDKLFKTRANILHMGDGDLTQQNFYDAISTESPFENMDIRYITDNRYSLAFRDYQRANPSVKLGGYSREKECHEENIDELQVNLCYEMFEAKNIPERNEEVLKLALKYYESLPKEYDHYTHAVTLDNISLWTLKLNTVYAAEVIAEFDVAAKFGDVVYFSIKEDDMHGRRITMTLTDGREIPMDDVSVREFFNAPLILLGEAKQDALDAGCVKHNVLDFKKGL